MLFPIPVSCFVFMYKMYYLGSSEAVFPTVSVEVTVDIC